MIIYFSGATGFTHRFVEKLGLPAQRIPLMSKDVPEFRAEEDFVLITPTYESKTQGFLPRQVAQFLNIAENRAKMRAVIGTGNINFGGDYAIAADKISEKVGIPVLYRLELAGTEEDVDIVREGLNSFWIMQQRIILN